MINIGTLEAILRLKDELTPSLKLAGQSLDNAGTKMKSAGAALMPLSLGLTAAGVASMKFAMDLNKGMANVATLIPENAQRVQELKTEIQDLAVAHGKATDDLVGGLYQTISAFGDTADTAKILEINSMAATAGMATTTEAINLTSAVTKGYGDTTAEAVEKASDLAFVTVKLGQTTFPELAASIGRVIPLAATLGVSQEELFAGFATLTGVTGDAAEVSTQFAAILRAMLKPTEDMQKGIAQLGYSSAEVMLSELGMVGALEQLIGTTDGSTEATAKLFGRAEALTAVFALTGAQADTFNEKLGAMTDATGATTTAFGEQTDGINAAGFAWSQFKVEVTVIAQKLGDELLPMLVSDVIPALKEMTGEVEEAVKWFKELSPEMKKTTAGGVAIAAAVGPAAILLGQMSLAAGGLVKFMGTLVGKFTLAAAAIGSVVKIGWDMLGWMSDGITMLQGLGDAAHKGEISVRDIYHALVDWMEEMPMIGKLLGWVTEKMFLLAEAWGLITFTKPPGIEETTHGIEGLTKSADETVDAFFKAGGSFEAFEKTVPPVTRAVEELDGKLDDIGGPGGSMNAAFAVTNDWASELPRATEALNQLSEAEFNAAENARTLEKAASDMLAAFDEGIQTTVPAIERFGLSIEDLQVPTNVTTNRIVDATTATVNWKEVTGDLTTAMGAAGNILSVFGVNVDSAIGKVTRLISSFGSMLKSISGIVGALRGGGGGGGGGGLIGAISSIGGALGGGGGGGGGGGIAGAAGGAGGIGGALGGIGSAIASGASAVMTGVTTVLAAIPVVGWIALAGIGTVMAIKKLFGGPSPFEQAGSELGNVFGQEFSRDLQFHIANQSEEIFGGNDMVAMAANAGEIISEALANGIETGELDMLAERMGDIFVHLDSGAIDANIASRELSESVAAITPYLDQMGESGVLQMERILAAAERTGVSFDGMDQFAIQYIQRADELGISVNNVVIEALGLEGALAELGQTGEDTFDSTTGAASETEKELMKVEGTAKILKDSMVLAAGDASTALLGMQVNPYLESEIGALSGALDDVGKSARAAGRDIEGMPGPPAGGGGVPAQHGFYSPSLPSDLTIRAHRGEEVRVTPAGQAAHAAPAPAQWGGVLEVRVIHETPDGRVLKREVRKIANDGLATGKIRVPTKSIVERAY
jgi:TP901 family phage tail tape measure protein